MAENIEDGYVTSDQNATRLAVVEDVSVVEMTVQCAQDVSSTDHGCMNDRVVVSIEGDDAGRRSRKNDLRHFLPSYVAEVFGYLFIS